MNKIKVHFIAMGAENLGIEALIASLEREGYDVSLSFEPSFFADLNSVYFPELSGLFERKREILKEIRRIRPDIIGISSMTDNYIWNINTAREIKQLFPDVKIIMGGIHPTLVPEEVIKEECIDFVLTGEADYSIVELLGKIKTGGDLADVPGLYYKNKTAILKSKRPPEFIEDLNGLPHIQKRQFYNTGLIPMDIYRTSASRGCPFNCSYCSNEFLHKLYRRNIVRIRSVENVITEIKNGKKNYKPLAIHFNDDIFTYNKEWLKNFCKSYKTEIDLPYSCITHPKFIDQEIAQLLKDSGCYRVQMGVQSLNQEIRRRYFRRFETNEEINNALTILDRIGISFSVDLIIGIPSQKTNALIQDAHYFSTFKHLKMINVYWLSFYPSLSIIDKVLIEDQKKREEIKRRISRGQSINYLSANKDDFYKDNKEELMKAEILLLSAGSLPEKLFNSLSSLFLKEGDKLYFLRYLMYLISILNIPDYSWLSYIKNYLKNSPLQLIRNIKSNIKTIQSNK